MRSTAATVLVILLGCAAGCATNTSHRPVHFQSDPAGADVYVDDEHRGKTPVTAMVSSWDAHRIRVELAGYEPYVLDQERPMRGFGPQLSVPQAGKVDVKLLAVGQRYSDRYDDVRKGIPAKGAR